MIPTTLPSFAPANLFRLLAIGVCLQICIASVRATPPVTNTSKIDFDLQVAPIIVSHCLECHSGTEPEGGFGFVEAKLALAESDSGPAIVPGDAAASLLWKRIATDEMPPKHPLSYNEKATVKKWIDEGAVWGTFSIDPFSGTTSTRAGRDWWSLQPLRKVVPSIPWHDFHATVLHLFGIDHTQLTFYHNGIQRRLTNVHGDVVHEIMA